MKTKSEIRRITTCQLQGIHIYIKDMSIGRQGEGQEQGEAGIRIGEGGGREQDRSSGRQGAGQEQGEAGSRTGEGGVRKGARVG